MDLSNLLPQSASLSLPPGSVPILGLTADSRAVKPGFLFAALPGVDHDGAKFIPDALERGAAAVLTHKAWQSAAAQLKDKLQDIPVVSAANPRRELALAAARYYGRQPKMICAVTGTNGKTSVAGFTRQIWAHIGVRAASMGTLGLRSPEAYIPLGHTTPDPVMVHRALNGLALAGVNHLALEASSHGLEQNRLDGVTISAAAFTNLTHDHLDYHASLEDYLFAKMRLFGEILTPKSVAVLNSDSEVFETLDQVCWGRGIGVFSIGKNEAATIRLVRQSPTRTGQTLRISYDGVESEIALPLVGTFQAMNALMSAGLVMATGGKSDEVFEALSFLVGAEGRMQHIGDTNEDASVYVDYAHTPDALETVLNALRPHTSGRLHVVFGCGGDRDRAKRAKMGAIAARLADVAIITDDNPRSEQADAIRQEILKGTSAASGPSAKITEVGDRGEAISGAIKELNPGDILIVAGKGHETGQIVGDKIVPFSDIEEVKTGLAKLSQEAKLSEEGQGT